MSDVSFNQWDDLTPCRVEYISLGHVYTVYTLESGEP